MKQNCYMRTANKFLLMALSVLLCCAQVPSAAFTEEGAARVADSSRRDSGAARGRQCGTLEELQEALDADEGGRIELTSSIRIGPGMFLYAIVERPVLVQMNGFGVEIEPEGEVYIRGPVRFEGTKPGGTLFDTQGGLGMVEGAEISAMGDDVIAIEEKGSSRIYLNNMSIYVQGKNAVALKLNTPKEYDMLHITAKGEGSAGIVTEQELELTLCAIKAQGDAVRCPDGMVTRLDSCSIFPRVNAVKVIERHAVPGSRIEHIGRSVKAGIAREDVYAETNIGEDDTAWVNYELYDKEKPGPETYVLALGLSGRAYGVPKDLTKPGTYPVRIVPDTPDWLPIELPDYIMPLHIVKEGTPWIANAYFIAMDEPIGIQFVFLEPIEDADSVTLEYSYDSIRWKEASGLGAYTVQNNSIFLSAPPPDVFYYFRLNVRGGSFSGYSNTLPFPYTSKDPSELGGGDRDGNDRDPQGGLPSTGGGQNAPSPDDARESSAEDGDKAVWVISDTPLPSAKLQEAKLETVPDISEQTSWKPPQNATITLKADELAAQLVANPDRLVLLGEGIRAVLPRELLAALAPQSAEVFSAELRRTQRGFVVRLWMGERELVEWGGGVRVDLYGVEPGMHCTGPDGRAAQPLGAEDGWTSFELPGPGEYLLLEPASQETPVAQPRPGDAILPDAAARVEAGGSGFRLLPPLLGLGAAALVFGWYAWRRKRGRE